MRCSNKGAFITTHSHLVKLEHNSCALNEDEKSPAHNQSRSNYLEKYYRGSIGKVLAKNSEGMALQNTNSSSQEFVTAHRLHHSCTQQESSDQPCDLAKEPRRHQNIKRIHGKSKSLLDLVNTNEDQSTTALPCKRTLGLAHQIGTNEARFILTNLSDLIQKNMLVTTTKVPTRILLLVILSTLVNHIIHHTHFKSAYDKQNQINFFNIPGYARAELTEFCNSDSDCRWDKTCFHNSCICPKDRPIDDRDKECRPQVMINDACIINEQCLGQSICIDGICACGSDAVLIWNPSTKINYCHPKGRIRDSCNFDTQCPNNAFCSGKGYGCLCLNGYGETVVKADDGSEKVECLSKTCAKQQDCESSYHVCEDNLCRCKAAHWNPLTASCYEFGSLGGGIPQSNLTKFNDGNKDSKGINSILNDLMRDGDKLWLVVIILVFLTLFLIALMIFILRKYYLGYCWTAHKKEYEPNNGNSPKSQFDKNSINNASFRRKKTELDDDCSYGVETIADKSNLVTTKKNTISPMERNGDNMNGNHYVKVDMREAIDETGDVKSKEVDHGSQGSVPTSRPLPSSLSTPV